MTHMAIRRSPAYKLRRTVSEILELIDAAEHSAAMFLRKGKHAELARAREDFATSTTLRQPILLWKPPSDTTPTSGSTRSILFR